MTHRSKLFYCASCQLDRPIEQLAKKLPNGTKRCKTCWNKAAEQRALLARTVGCAPRTNLEIDKK